MYVFRLVWSHSTEWFKICGNAACSAHQASKQVHSWSQLQFTWPPLNRVILNHPYMVMLEPWLGTPDHLICHVISDSSSAVLLRVHFLGPLLNSYTQLLAPVWAAVYKVMYTVYTMDDDVSDISISNLDIWNFEWKQVRNWTCGWGILRQQQTAKLMKKSRRNSNLLGGWTTAAFVVC